MEKKKILIIDDDQSICTILEQSLSSIGYEIFKEHDGTDGLMSTFTNSPELILLDLSMRNMDGFEFLRLLRSNKDFKHTPVMIISGDNKKELVLKAVHYGVLDYIVKPFGIQEIRDKVDSFFYKHGPGIKEKQKIDHEIFEKIDIRFGRVDKYEEIPDNKNMIFKLHIDFGKLLGTKIGMITVPSNYNIEKIKGQLIACAVNFKQQFGAEVYVLKITPDENNIGFLIPDKADIEPGTQVY